MDYGINVSVEEANNRCLGAEDKKLPSNSEDNIGKNSEVYAAKDQGKAAESKVPCGYGGKSKPELISTTTKPSLVSRPTVHNSKLEKEEIWKKMEELLIQRQKRIAAKTAANGLAPSASKKSPLQSKTAKSPIRYDRNKSASRETNRNGSMKIRAT